MSDPSSQHDLAPPKENKDHLYAQRFGAFKEALQCLYIRDNMGGRIRFLKEWPAMANFLFPEELKRFDYDGVSSDDDIEKRSALEEQAEHNLIVFMHDIEDLDQKSFKDGVLKVDHFKDFAQRYGHDIAALIYAEDVMKKAYPQWSPNVNEVDENDSEESTSKMQGAQAAQQEKPPRPVVEDTPPFTEPEKTPLGLRMAGSVLPTSEPKYDIGPIDAPPAQPKSEPEPEKAVDPALEDNSPSSQEGPQQHDVPPTQEETRGPTIELRASFLEACARI